MIISDLLPIIRTRAETYFDVIDLFIYYPMYLIFYEGSWYKFLLYFYPHLFGSLLFIDHIFRVNTLPVSWLLRCLK